MRTLVFGAMRRSSLTARAARRLPATTLDGRLDNRAMHDPLALAKQMYEALEDDDVGPFLTLCAPDVTIEYPAAGRLPYGGTWMGRSGAADFLAAHDAAEEIVLFDPAPMHLATADLVFVLGTFEGRARDTGRRWRTEFVHVLTFRDGRLTGWRSFFDTATAVAAHSGRG